MATLGRNPPRFLDQGMRRKVEVSTAMAWEALVDEHVDQASRFVRLLSEHEPVEDALPRYLREMDLHETMATAVRTRVLMLAEQAAAEPPTDRPAALRFPARDDADDFAPDDDFGWGLLRQPQRVVRGVRRRQRRTDEIDRITMLALARAEESVIEVHVENAIGFVALLESQLSFDRAVQHYIGAVGLTGGRAQSVLQRTMARLAQVHLGER
ncbi:MAG: hypothetical protein WD054_02125 [Gemmatimonadota bacterium]